MSLTTVLMASVTCAVDHETFAVYCNMYIYIYMCVCVCIYIYIYIYITIRV